LFGPHSNEIHFPSGFFIRTESQRGSIMINFSIQKRSKRSLRGWLAFCGVAALGAGTTLSGEAYGQQSDPANSGVVTASDSSHMSYNGSAYRVVNASSLSSPSAGERNAVIQAAGLANNSMLARNAVVPVAYNQGCSSCGTSSCGGACGGSMGYSAYGSSDYQPRFGSGAPTACGTPCNPYSYASIDGVYMRRSGDENFSFSQNFGFIDGFSYEWAPRITMGVVPDCVHGYEVSFIGVYEWDQTASMTAAPGQRIRTRLVDGLSPGDGSLIAFVDTPAVGFIPGAPAVPGVSPAIPDRAATPESFSVAQSEFYNADYWSLEANQTLVGYDLVKVLYGTRYISYDELLGYTSTNNLGATGALFNNVENQLFGVQLGIDMLYPVSCHGYMDFRGRAGAYYNRADSSTTLINDGNVVLANAADDSEIAGFFEIGTGIRYQLGEALSLRAGSEFWYLTGVASARDQVPFLVTSNIGSRVSVDDDIFFLGLSVNAEYKY
jgi:hypothetical protein